MHCLQCDFYRNSDSTALFSCKPVRVRDFFRVLCCRRLLVFFRKQLHELFVAVPFDECVIVFLFQFSSLELL